MSNTTISLQSVTDLARTHAELVQLAGVGGFTNEPALSLCNDVITEMFAQPSAWKFNRKEMPIFFTAIYRQDYLFGGASAFTIEDGGAGIALATAGTPGVSRTGTTVTVTTLEPHNFPVGRTVYMLGNVDNQFNSTFSQSPIISGYSGGWTILTTPTPTSFTFTHAVSGTTTSGAPGITNFGWLESGTMREAASTAPIPRTWDLEGVNDIHPTSMSSIPRKVCVLSDNGDGTIKIRFQYVPGSSIFGVNLVYQGLPPIKTALTGAGIGDWSPIPDQFSFVYRQGFLWRAWRYINSPKADSEYMKFQAAISKASGRDDAEQSDQRMYPEESLLDIGGCGDDF